MKEAYALIQNPNMMKIIDQIDQIINGKVEIGKINPNLELLNIQGKLNQILTKFEKKSRPNSRRRKFQKIQRQIQRRIQRRI